MRASFFNINNRQFWTYHLIALAMLSLVQALIIILWRDQKLFNAIGGIAWAIYFTLSVLSYRWCYLRHDWQHLNTLSSLFKVFWLSIVAGVMVTSLMLVSVLPFFWNQLLAIPEIQNKGITPFDLVIQLFISNTFQTQLFFCGWAFIYMGITTNRRARETELNNLRLQNSLKEAQLANLTNQLNPHFLFNALNNIRFSIFEHPRNAEAMLTELAELLRYSLESNQKQKVSVDQELTMVNHYLKIMKIQMENRLNYHQDVGAGCDKLLVPPMILQLLVENAIKHGLDQRRHGGILGLKIAIQEKHLLIQVRNNLADSASRQPRSTGLGLTNIESRLKLLYASNATIKTETTNEEFIVRLQLPLERSL